MTRFEIAWAYWTGLVLVAVIGGMLIFVCGPSELTCASRSVTAVVLDLVNKNARLAISTFDLDDIAKTGEDPQAGTISCSATVWAYHNNTPYTSAPLTYTIARQADGKFNVSVEGITGLRKSLVP